MNKNKVAALEHAGPFKGARRRLSRKANRCYYHYNNICFLAAGKGPPRAAKSNLFQTLFGRGKKGETNECSDRGLRGRGI